MPPVSRPDGSALLAYMRRSDVDPATADGIMAAVHEWMDGHLVMDPYTDVHRLAALAAGKNSLAAVASPGGVTATDVGFLFIRDSDPDIRRAASLYAVGGFA